ncbi:Chromosome partition protein Smc [bacterium HR39]|nr:Chromosome partition protein Smc [bacterium HR39]
MEGEEAGLAELEGRLAQLAERRVRLDGEIAALAAEAARAQADLRRREEALARARESAAGARSRLQHATERERETAELVERLLGRTPRELDAGVLAELDAASAELVPAELGTRIRELGARLERYGGVNLAAARELAEVERELSALEAERAELEGAIARLREAMARLEHEARARLSEAFATVDAHFRRLFARLFGGGEARLRLAGSEDPLECGLEMEVRPPGKKLQHAGLLSGGEKSLCGLALVFAFFLHRPAPLCVLDEVDAALDDANVGRFCDVLEEIAGRTGTRFLVITHHPLTMARMDRLYGVTMSERGVSRVVAVELAEAVELQATA